MDWRGWDCIVVRGTGTSTLGERGRTGLGIGHSRIWSSLGRALRVTVWKPAFLGVIGNRARCLRHDLWCGDGCRLVDTASAFGFLVFGVVRVVLPRCAPCLRRVRCELIARSDISFHGPVFLPGLFPIAISILTRATPSPHSLSWPPPSSITTTSLWLPRQFNPFFAEWHFPVLFWASAKGPQSEVHSTSSKKVRARSYSHDPTCRRHDIANSSLSPAILLFKSVRQPLHWNFHSSFSPSKLVVAATHH